MAYHNKTNFVRVPSFYPTEATSGYNERVQALIDALETPPELEPCARPLTALQVAEMDDEIATDIEFPTMANNPTWIDLGDDDSFTEDQDIWDCAAEILTPMEFSILWSVFREGRSIHATARIIYPDAKPGCGTHTYRHFKMALKKLKLWLLLDQEVGVLLKHTQRRGDMDFALPMPKRYVLRKRRDQIAPIMRRAGHRIRCYKKRKERVK